MESIDSQRAEGVWVRKREVEKKLWSVWQGCLEKEELKKYPNYKKKKASDIQV